METKTEKSELMKEFGYLMDRIESQPFAMEPFKHLLIDDFLSPEHFKAMTTAVEINRPVAPTTEKLIEDLQENGYTVQTFPGCTSSIDEYLTAYNSGNWGVDKHLLEGFGIAFRLNKYTTPIVRRFVEFLNLPEFQKLMEKKFGLTHETSVETAIQKYLHGYEISPHPDIRLKAATYMLNINTREDSESFDIHTYLLKFKPEKKYIYDFWRDNPKIERCWVPWPWCDVKATTNKNNSIVFFAPSNDTLHAVKLDYDHLKFQRTQVYGNLWYTEKTVKYDSTYDDLASENDLKAKIARKIASSFVPNSIKVRLSKFLKK